MHINDNAVSNRCYLIIKAIHSESEVQYTSIIYSEGEVQYTSIIYNEGEVQYASITYISMTMP